MAVKKKIIITGGAGYVGSVLVPYLLRLGYEVTVIDYFIYGEEVFGVFQNSPFLHLVKGDIRDQNLLYKTFHNQDILVHLACISNDPSFDLNPNLGRSINYDAFKGIIKAVNESNVQRFIYASSSSVYGVRTEDKVIETTSCEPLTDYSKYKLLCEKMLQDSGLKNCDYTIIRPATVCGYAPRLRLDLTVNILTLHALVSKKMTVFGGSQLRPHIYIEDMVEAYRLLLEAPKEKIAFEVFNAGYENRSVLSTAQLIQNQLFKVGVKNIEIVVQPTNDNRSYYIDSVKIQQRLGFMPKYSLEDAIDSLINAYKDKKIIDPLNNALYYNIKRMKEINLV